MSDEEYGQMLDWLYNLRRFGMKLDMSRIGTVLHALGNPQDRLKIIHVAGTNGKGSVCAMMSAILQKAGFRVGLFTSPHLVDFRERFQINGKMISKAEIFELVNEIKKTGIEMTFFEFTTAIAFLYFSRQNVDYLVLEVGLGGRYDATNIIQKPVATVITSISFDHIEWLGDTLDKIAFEKAGIIKRGVPLFTRVQSDVIKNICDEKDAPFIFVDNLEKTNMNGKFQEENAGLAAEIARFIGINEQAIKAGLQNVTWPARLEFIESNILLDCAHNEEGIRAMTRFVSSLGKDVTILFGVMGNKDYQKMLALLPFYSKIIFTRPKISRSLDPNELKKICPDALIIEDVSQAYEQAKKISGKDDLILVCGSCYLAGELLAYKNNIQMHPIMFVQ